MKFRQTASTDYPITFLMVSATDHITGKTGLTPTVTISKNGGTFGSPAGAVSEIGNGWYKIAGNATDRDTNGELLIHAEGTGADPVDERYTIAASSVVVTMVSPFNADENRMDLNINSDYLTAHGWAILLSSASWPTLTGGTVAMRVAGYPHEIDGAVTGAGSVRFEITQALLTELGVGHREYEVIATLASSAGAGLMSGVLSIAGLPVVAGQHGRQRIWVASINSSAVLFVPALVS